MTGNGLSAPGQTQFWVVIPAAGIGARMQADRPKQYLPLLGKTVIEHTLDHLLEHPRIAGLVVAISPSDTYWQNLPYAGHPRVISVTGGNVRAASVLNGLNRLNSTIAQQDWVLVHDAVRPCISYKDLDQLFNMAAELEQGAILGMPVRDTIKQADQRGVIEKTVDRSCLWHALTPQMFRLGQLINALETSVEQQFEVTDEASAMENIGYHPLLIAGDVKNIKITRPEDLPLAEMILSTALPGN
jgi:2-C-methyl-D-erythritol 4-phosphate cytidylyltransferase